MSNNHNNINNNIIINHNRITNHHHHHRLLPQSSTTTTTRSNSTTQACAACRYQRRKCAPDCVLAPYFPHDRQRQFQNAHKLFGVSNITKIIRDLDKPQKDEAMRTIMYQADVRAHDPVGGCYRIIRELQRQIEISRAELEIVLHQLAFCRAHAQNVNNNNNNNNNDNNNHHLHEPQHQHQHQHQHDQLLIEGVDFDLDLGQMGQQKDHDQYHDGEYILVEQNLNEQEEARVQEMNSWANMSNSPASSAVCLEVKPPVDECEQFKGLLINEIPAGERHEFKFEFDDINEASEETLFNDGNHKALTKEENVAFFTKEDNGPYQQQNEDNDLKSAATLFTLTNCSSY